MINVNLSNRFIQISGHAGKARAGKDIICASVSTSIILTINLIEKLELLKEIEYKLEEGFFQVKYSENDLVNKVMENLIFMLTDLQSTYPKFIQIGGKTC